MHGILITARVSVMSAIGETAAYGGGIGYIGYTRGSGPVTPVPAVGSSTTGASTAALASPGASGATSLQSGANCAECGGAHSDHAGAVSSALASYKGFQTSTPYAANGNAAAQSASSAARGQVVDLQF